MEIAVSIVNLMSEEVSVTLQAQAEDTASGALRLGIPKAIIIVPSGQSANATVTVDAIKPA